jgi:hypothetical protein
MGKAEERRAAIVAQQAARELAERGERQASGKETRSGKRRTNWAASPPFAGARRGRPPAPKTEE